MSISLETTITDITVFQSRAQVVRQGTLDLDAGQHLLIVSDLPPSLVEDRVRANLNEGGARILAVEVVTGTPGDTELPQNAEHDDLLAALQADDKQLVREQAVTESRHKMLESLAQSVSEHLGRVIAEGNAGVDRIQEVADYLGQELGAVLAQAEDYEHQHKRIQQEITRLKGERKNPAWAKRWREIHVLVDVPAPMTLQLTVTCVFTDASWQPVYELRVGERAVELVYAAQIRQRTGAEWPALPLTLSTERTAKLIDTATIPPWIVQIQLDKSERRRRRERPDRMETVQLRTRRMDDSDDDDESQSQTQPQAHVVEAGPGVSFVTQHPLPVRADNSPQKIVIGTVDLSAELDYGCVPKLLPKAIQRAKITNTSSLTLLPGQATLFFGTEYIGTARIGTVAPGEMFVVNLGVEDRIRVRRELVEHDVITDSDKNVHQLTHTYQITVTNHMDRRAKVTVRDQIPSVVHGDITVTLGDVTPELDDHSKTNILRWRVTIPPQESAEIHFSFVVEYPRDKPITGIL